MTFYSNTVSLCVIQRKIYKYIVRICILYSKNTIGWNIPPSKISIRHETKWKPPLLITGFYTDCSTPSCITLTEHLYLIRIFIYIKRLQGGIFHPPSYISDTKLSEMYYYWLTVLYSVGGGRVVRWSWVNFQCRGVLHFR